MRQYPGALLYRFPPRAETAHEKVEAAKGDNLARRLVRILR